MLTLSIALGSFGARMSHMRKWNALAFKRPRIQDAQMETTYRVLTREVLECARAFKGRRDVFRISIDYILELLARFARSPTSRS